MNYQICTRCVMDTSHKEISFDGEGVCSFCMKYKEDASKLLLPPEQREIAFRQIITNMRATRSGEYDCILGLSGGVDSSYLAYILAQNNLKVLAVQFDNGWNSELAVSNIKTLCDKLGLDLFTYVVEWAEFRDLQISFLKASVANVEIPTDHGIIAALYQVAAERGIKNIISGVNLVTEQISCSSYGYDYRDLAHIKAIHRRFGNVKLKSYPQMSYWKRLYLRHLRGIRSISLLNYMDYQKDKALEVIGQLGWRTYPMKHGESVFTRFHQTYILPRKFGVDKRRAHFSNLIWSGQMSREQAFAELAKPPLDESILSQDKEYILKKLQLTENQFDTIINAPPKDYTAYPNQAWLFNAHAALGRMLSH